MVTRTLSIAAVLALASFAHADDTARKVKVALALSKGQDCQKDKVKSALDAALPKSKERKVAEALMPISTAPMPRECKDGKCESCPCSLGCDCSNGKCSCGAFCSCPNCPDSYAGAYAKAKAGQRVTFDLRADDRTRPAEVPPGKYEFWSDAAGMHFRKVDPVRVPVNPVRVQYPAYPFGNGPVCLPGRA